MALTADRPSVHAIDSSRSSVVMKQLGAACGILYPALTYVGYYTLGNAGDAPPRDAPVDAYAQFFATNTTTWTLLGLYVELIGLACLIVFVPTLWSVLASAEGARGWLSGVVLGSGVMMAAMKMGSAAPYIVAMQRSDEGLDPRLARTLLDLNNAAFALTWIPLAVLIGATAAVVIQTAILPRWLGWIAAVISVGLLAGAPLMWSTERAIIVFVLALIWLVAASVTLMLVIGRQDRSAEPASVRSLARRDSQ
jgi:hypothetical protein